MERTIIFSDNNINLYDIDYTSRGIIIVYRNHKPLGSIVYDGKNEFWKFFTYINLVSCDHYDNTLKDLCETLQYQNDN